VPPKRSRPSAKKRPPPRDPIAEAILKARTRAGLTQRELADRLVCRSRNHPPLMHVRNCISYRQSTSA
jgi:hypothetical protein